MKKTSYGIWLALCLICLSFNTFANNLRITDVVITSDSKLSFKISWENSWRVDVAPNNHDAVWIFLKKRDCASNNWSHVDLDLNPSAHSVGSPLEIYIDGKDSSTVAKGLFVRRSSVGVGNILDVSVELTTAGVNTQDFEFQVHGIEMVYIPQGAFYLGDGSNTSNGFFKASSPASYLPYFVESEAPIRVGTSPGDLSAAGLLTAGTIRETFPKGYAAVYCMKYEITQGQYVAFLNTLPAHFLTGSNSRFYDRNNTNRVDIRGSYQAFTTRWPYRACGFLDWTDVLAYLDWSALRPMTEFEFEKICKGPLYPQVGMYSWGNNIIHQALSANIVADGTQSERDGAVIVGGGGKAVYANGVAGPMRVGQAAGLGTSRTQAGATYYGVMDMTGNVWEQTVNHSSVDFDGRVGDGMVNELTGSQNVPRWPFWNIAITRGGAYDSAVGNQGCVRYRGATISNRPAHLGGRGVR